MANDKAGIGFLGARQAIGDLDGQSFRRRNPSMMDYRDQSQSSSMSDMNFSRGMRGGVMSVRLVDAFEKITEPLIEAQASIGKQQVIDRREGSLAIRDSIAHLTDVYATSMGNSEALLGEISRKNSELVESSKPWKALNLITTPLRWMSNTMFGWRNSDPFSSGFDKISKAIEEQTEFLATGEIDRTRSLWQRFTQQGLLGMAGRGILGQMGFGVDAAQRREDARSQGEHIGFSITGFLNDHFFADQTVYRGRRGGLIAANRRDAQMSIPESFAAEMQEWFTPPSWDGLANTMKQGGVLYGDSKGNLSRDNDPVDLLRRMQLNSEDQKSSLIGSASYERKTTGQLLEGMYETEERDFAHLKNEKKGNNYLHDIRNSLRFISGTSFLGMLGNTIGGILGGTFDIAQELMGIKSRRKRRTALGSIDDFIDDAIVGGGAAASGSSRKAGKGIISMLGEKMVNLAKQPQFLKNALRFGGAAAVFELALTDEEIHGSEIEKTVISTTKTLGFLVGGLVSTAVLTALGAPAAIALIGSVVGGWVAKHVGEGIGTWLTNQMDEHEFLRNAAEYIHNKKLELNQRTTQLWEQHKKVVENAVTGIGNFVDRYMKNPEEIFNDIEIMGDHITKNTIAFLDEISRFMRDPLPTLGGWGSDLVEVGKRMNQAIADSASVWFEQTKAGALKLLNGGLSIIQRLFGWGSEQDGPAASPLAKEASRIRFMQEHGMTPEAAAKSDGLMKDKGMIWMKQNTKGIPTNTGSDMPDLPIFDSNSGTETRTQGSSQIPRPEPSQYDGPGGANLNALLRDQTLSMDQMVEELRKSTEAMNAYLRESREKSNNGSYNTDVSSMTLQTIRGE